ncbi:MAG TPA: hypothetical protein DDZ04_09270 [Parabacteroides sp.]|nr:hypothetical protein [Parabacteroides sp.]
MYHNVLSAAKDADSFLVIKINEQRQIVVQYILPQNAKTPHDKQTFGRFNELKSGTYIFPLKSGEVLNFPYPELKVDNPESIYSLLLCFKQLQAKAEASFLIGNLLNQQSNIRFAALKRMQEIGFFNMPFNKNTATFFKKFYAKTNLSVPEKRLLLEAFAVSNFNQMTDVYILALSDHKISKLSGQIFYVKNRGLFTSIVKKYVSNEKLWKTALKQSEFFIEDKDFTNKAMKWFDRKNFQNNSADFIPLLFVKTKNNSYNEGIIKSLLLKSKNTKSFELYQNLAYWLNHSNAENFNDEIIQFLINNKKNDYITESIIYPTMLSALKKSGHPQANKLLLEYLENLKLRNNQQLTDQVCILFKKNNQPNPTIDSLINGLK